MRYFVCITFHKIQIRSPLLLTHSNEVLNESLESALSAAMSEEMLLYASYIIDNY